MESSAIARYNYQKSEKRVFSGSSSSCAEPEVMEIAPPLTDRRSKMKAKRKHEEAIYHEIIDVDVDEDCNNVVLLQEKVDSNNKRKRSMGISIGPNSAAEKDSKLVASSKKGKEILGHSPNGFNSGSNNFFNLDDYVFDDEYWTMQSCFDDIGLPAGINAPSPWLTESVPLKKSDLAIPFVTSNAQLEASASQLKKNTAVGGHSTYFDSKYVPAQTIHTNFTQNGSSNYNTQDGNGTSSYPQLAMSTGYPQGIDMRISKLHESIMKNHMELNEGYKSAGMLSGTGGIYYMNDKDAYVNSPASTSLSKVKCSSGMPKLVDGDVKKRFESFKKFDTVKDHSDHYYNLNQKSAMKQPPKNWVKKIQQEWRILEKDLPDTIFVRVYESRMDLLRAVIIGAEGTPYHDGLYFFDVCFPSNYPSSPPLVHYHSGGVRINPNLYDCGKVCLSLLNTWTGGHEERWLPNTSTMLQVLVSIQGLILNMKPYFNEPGYAHSSGSSEGEKCSVKYNEDTLILSLKTMVYTMRNPPKHFEDLVIGHFQHHARDILMACKAYTEGVQVGCLVKGGVQDVDEGSNSCSPNFRHLVGSYIKTLVAAFEKIGAKEAQNFLFLNVK
ncbi:hypothetical protein R6Q59_012950 [Mikania micrantha]|uniref:E2 ubiquitin-conjugating enzyme n=1 Tax=Mikania micrantha TaxID=192012 RepID=A0A5N6LNW7_9ASTR|nr:hypothetical protein E3N88_40899 [Mikania micrantha]